ncbi:DUF6941 family protein [Planctellipticum variicoloris]|uniref:DUF6941 family protein n=1 Tax=Planctellipticum variicoloris TaxID=3064265 RepID=UPI003013DDD4|nr:hypothetical protein SH412_004515 [Planctomycetaceae bacterium SH412]
MSRSETPRALAMILCDAFHRCPTTHKYTILGTFDRVTLAELPGRLGFCVYSVFAEGQGEIPFTLRVVDMSGSPGEEPELFSTTGRQHFVDPLETKEFVDRVEFECSHPGIYLCEFASEGVTLISRRLHVLAETDDE